LEFRLGVIHLSLYVIDICRYLQEYFVVKQENTDFKIKDELSLTPNINLARTIARLTRLLSTMSGPLSPAAAPWKAAFDSHLQKLGSAPEFSLATVNHEGFPRARTCIHRGFWTVLPKNSHNDQPKNPALFESDCPTLSTDARMSKVYDIFATSRGKGTQEQSRAGTGGGGPVEAVYWVKETMTQWRIRGQCWIIASDDVEAPGEGDMQNSGTVTMKAVLQRYMRRKQDGPSGEWSWKREVENHFGNLSPGMRGSFKNPPPGQLLADNVGTGEKMGQKAELDLKKEDLARKNFRVAVITPEQVEQLDLSDPAKNQRWIWTLESQGHAGDAEEGKALEWKMVEIWP
jgi:pyridoxamine 5'-phosphate oxidase